MKVLFDTNIVLDVMLGREPFVDVAIQLFSISRNWEVTRIFRRNNCN